MAILLSDTSVETTEVNVLNCSIPAAFDYCMAYAMGFRPVSLRGRNQSCIMMEKHSKDKKVSKTIFINSEYNTHQNPQSFRPFSDPTQAERAVRGWFTSAWVSARSSEQIFPTKNPHILVPSYEVQIKVGDNLRTLVTPSLGHCLCLNIFGMWGVDLIYDVPSVLLEESYEFKPEEVLQEYFVPTELPTIKQGNMARR